MYLRAKVFIDDSRKNTTKEHWLHKVTALLLVYTKLHTFAWQWLTVYQVKSTVSFILGKKMFNTKKQYVESITNHTDWTHSSKQKKTYQCHPGETGMTADKKKNEKWSRLFPNPNSLVGQWFTFLRSWSCFYCGCRGRMGKILSLFSAKNKEQKYSFFFLFLFLLSPTELVFAMFYTHYTSPSQPIVANTLSLIILIFWRDNTPTKQKYHHDTTEVHILLATCYCSSSSSFWQRPKSILSAHWIGTQVWRNWKKKIKKKNLPDSNDNNNHSKKNKYKQSIDRESESDLLFSLGQTSSRINNAKSLRAGLIQKKYSRNSRNWEFASKYSVHAV